MFCHRLLDSDVDGELTLTMRPSLRSTAAGYLGALKKIINTTFKALLIYQHRGLVQIPTQTLLEQNENTRAKRGPLLHFRVPCIF